MTTEELISAAQDALGTSREDDYVIQPTKHAEDLSAKAPALAALLRKSALSTMAEDYERKDREANRNRDSFKRTANFANWAVLLTACFSTLLLVVPPITSLLGVPDNAAVVVLGVLAAISGALGTMWLYRAREGKLLDSWMSARATAEVLRAQYFEAVTSVEAAPSNSAIPIPLLQFEYFRRYQLDVQRAHYSTRGDDHRRGAERQLRRSALAVALASVSAVLATLLSSLDVRWVALAALGSIAAALSSFASTEESVNQSRRNAEQYGKAYDALGLLRRKLDDVRIAAASGERAPIKEFVSAVHEQMAAEHRQWLAAAQNIQPAIDKLDQLLAELKSKKEEPPPAAQAPGQG